ncbi:MAG TPA: sodium:solute symporter [Polyangia bacterium]|jgi:SSS family transporter
MSLVDWLVLGATLAAIVAYGVWKGRAVRTADAYLRGGSDFKWYTIGLSIMATQASAITFLSTPGQAYEDGMGFVQFYFGLPIAMVLLCATIVPVYHRLRVTTAYEYLEGRFDQKTRQLTAFLFLVQRGLGAGLSIYAPAIILSSVLGLPLHLTNLVIGGFVILYTVSGGSRAVSQTQTPQMVVMMGGMALAFVFVLHALPAGVSLGDAFHVAGSLDRMKVIDLSARFDTRYTLWSGLTGGLFVALAYFGTDQSQVQRYLSGSTVAESRLGLLFNGLVKVPMQFFILLVGLMVFVFYQFNRPPVFFHEAELARVERTAHAPALRRAEAAHARAFADKQAQVERYLAARRAHDGAAEAAARAGLREAEGRARAARAAAKSVIKRALPGAEVKDADYVFITFVTRHFPRGLVGLLVAVIFCAAMSATASALSALGSTTVVDFYRRSFVPAATDAHYLRAAKVFTVLWGALAVGFAAFASLLDNLIQAVNILGSIFYGPTLGVFLVGFFLKRVRGTPTFVALIAGQAAVLLTFALSSIGFLWYNVIGCAAVVALAVGLDAVWPRARPV